MTEEHKKPLIAPAAEKAADVARADVAQDAPKDLSKKAWDESKNKTPWNATAKGRFAIRTFSRGVMGAAFFTAGGLWNKKLLSPAGNISHGFAESENYLASRSFSEQKNPLQFLAKTIDTVVGKPIEYTVNALGGNGLDAVHFKPTKYVREYAAGHFGKTGDPVKVYGRSLGEETIALTFDFFMASIGDAMGRDIVGWFDPAVKKDWVDDKGHVKLPEAMKGIAKTAWRYVSYNGGEDWAVALPYVYFIKSSRHLIDKKLTKGYRFESDVALNKGCLKMNNTSEPHRIVGSYSFEAMLDYQGRFTAYNMGTLLYREAYDKAAHLLKGEHINLYGSPDAPQKEHETIGEKIHDTVKWGLRGVIKGFICMTPAVPFFSITRATQNRNLGVFINPESNSVLSFKDKTGYHLVTTADVKADLEKFKKTPVHYADFNHDPAEGKLGYNKVKGTHGFDPHIANPAIQDKFDAYVHRNNVIENSFSWIGWTSEKLTHILDTHATKFENFTPRFSNGLKYVLAVPKMGDGNYHSFTRFTQPTIHAAISYTPYMFMKAETAKLWDNGKTDLAVERLIDGAEKLSWNEFTAGAGELRDALLNRPFADKNREKEARRRTKVDTSAADTALFDPDAEEKNDKLLAQEQAAERAKTFAKPELKKTSELGWQERLVKGRSEEGDVQTVSTKHSPNSHAEREAMRKVLEESQPPTNSVH